jgi:hypothetical protein
MKSIMMFFFMLTLTSGFAQNTVSWKGGTPGRETSWKEPRNWSNYQVPDEYTHVIIAKLHTGHYAQPVIHDLVEVASIRVLAGASLKITDQGEIVIDGSLTYTEGIVTQGGSIINEGRIQMVEVEAAQPDQLEVENRDSGIVLLNGQPLESKGLARR